MYQKPPSPLVKTPRLIKSSGLVEKEWKVGKGYSIGEVRAAGLNIKEARLLGIYVDKRRKNVWDVNVKNLKEWLISIAKGEIQPPLPTLPKKIKIKRKRDRVFRGLTPSGRRMRGLVSTRLRETHRYKWKKKTKERELKKKHEAIRSKGGH